MAKFIAIIHFDCGTGRDPDIEHVEADTINDAWKKLIKGRWGDYDPRLGGFEDPHTAVKNDTYSGSSIDSVDMYHVLAEDNSNYFDAWYESACEAYAHKEAEKQDAADQTEFERLKKKLNK